MPPVFGPVSPSPRRLWSRASGRARAALAVAQGDEARLRAVQPLLDDHDAARVRRASRRSPARRDSRSSHTVTPLPAASPSALTTTPRPSSASVAAKASAARIVGERLGAGHPDARRGRDLVAERLAALDPRGRLARPEDRDARRAERIGHAGRERRLGPDDHELDRLATGERHDRGSVERIDAATQRTRGSSAMAPLPGATMTSLTPGSALSFQASACSRPPPPTMRMRVGMRRLAALTPGSPAGCASGARPARWSGSAPARPTRGRSGPRHAPRWR